MINRTPGFWGVTSSDILFTFIANCREVSVYQGWKIYRDYNPDLCKFQKDLFPLVLIDPLVSHILVLLNHEHRLFT